MLQVLAPFYSNLSGLILLPLLGSLIILVIPNSRVRLIRGITIWTSLITFLYSLFFWIRFENDTAKFQFVETIRWLPYSNINFYIGIDGISLFFVILTTFLTPICILVGFYSVKSYKKEYMIAFFICESFLIAVFCSLDLLIFYVFFESVLIPMFIIIGVWGSRQRKIKAAYQFFLYTLMGSLFMLLAILFIFFQTGTTDLQILLTTEFSERRQILLWIAFFASFSVKVPMVPVHIWLPEAHVEAPTAGSVILAGILLKLGTYGFLRFSIPMFPEATLYFTPFIYTLSVIAIIYTSLTTIRQIDLKKIIAYSSVAHMNFVTIGMFSLNIQGIEGSILLMLSHGLVSSALFLCVGALYDRHKTRIVKYYGGLVSTMPIFSTIFLFFTLANMSLPGTSSFIGEFLILVGAFQRNSLVATLAALGMILGAAYSLWLYNRVVFGNFKPNFILKFSDLNRREVLIFLPFIVGVIWMGVYPEVFLECMHTSVSNLVQHGKFD
ncbi:NADH dehydrogenase subunit 4 (mitochondrion) [Marchantia polymorpha subsp. ruderalis]|uniref:NADH-ubiquinone oxidoreductase chain 4 n=18 Tax=Embryophyta TaxID=3193 RepID=NU4M_MARPO|nr:NADH dehydrogenase subunit 4 [Marchantia paleacea]YP_009479679.1 NADH dehydrogenase subunit 4 [Marchantia polymorpha subsp. ruderalis]P26848.2 RecName: Full=NADH-ubiquinone oxidoreductase chain 4; AltName: Full=NADH dehydrogenase subunit 4 [Marchantia polymorpha]QIA59597.1 NADH dehydrogenase subunit 4 [Conocephalum conicum]QIA59681.1 NADH dehydrogenase subunit 4 [Lunularia cruciata]QIA59847.1 NADH dehydrogenase subunit 4 [Riccia cavernosa]AAC09398.1 nad4 [Marchantia paleacea]QBE89496.1 NA